MKDYTTTEDGRYIIINGREWRASDPSIPKALRSQLVAVLMKARNDVAKALRSNDKILEKNARSRVNDAKISLGERGAVWWEPYDDTALRSRLKSSMLTLLRHREPGKSICPSEAARVIGSPDHWRTVMPVAREVAVELAIVLQGGICEKAGSDTFVVTTLQIACFPTASVKPMPLA